MVRNTTSQQHNFNRFVRLQMAVLLQIGVEHTRRFNIQ
jgi:hypothetical protein